MTRRKVLSLVMCGIVTAAIAGYFTPLLLSMGPNQKGEAALPDIDTSEIRPGEIALVEHPMHGEIWSDYRWSILFFRSQTGELFAWDVPSKNGVLVMPDWHWWRPSGVECQDFSPKLTSDGQLFYQCHDEMGEYYQWFQTLVWDSEGKIVNGRGGDMLATIGSEERGRFKVGRPAH